MSQSRYWIEAMRLIENKSNIQKHQSRVPMALHNAKIHRPLVYVSAKVNYEKMLESEELAGHIPRSNLPLIRRNKRKPSYAQASVKMSTVKGAPKLEGISVRSLVCSRCKLSAAQTTAPKETTKNETKHKVKEKPRSDRKGKNISKPVQNASAAAVEHQNQAAVHFQPKKVFPGTSLPRSSRQTWRLSEKTSSDINRLISLLHALDDLPRKSTRTKRQTIVYQQPSEPKRPAPKLSKPRRMADAVELFFLQAGELSLRNILVKEDEVLSGLLHVSSKRPTPQHTAMGKFASSVATPIRSTESEQSTRVPDTDKNDQYKRHGVTSKRKDPKQSSRCSSDTFHQDKTSEERILHSRVDHQGHMFPALERSSVREGVDTPKQSCLPPLYISHHSTTYFSHKQSTTKQAGRGLPRETRKGKDHLQHPSSFSRDRRTKRNGDSVITERRSSISKGALPPIVIPRVTTPLRGFTPWTDVTCSPCMLNSTTDDTDDCTEIP